MLSLGVPGSLYLVSQVVYSVAIHKNRHLADMRPPQSTYFWTSLLA